MEYTTDINTIRDLFTTDCVFQVPKFQRNYIWGEEEWRGVWQTIKQLNQDTPRLFGFMIITYSSDIEGTFLDRYYLIDGQQRLVTLSLMLNAFKKRFSELGNEDLAANIGNLLYKGLTEEDIILDLNEDQEEYKSVIEGKDKQNNFSDCYDFFYSRLEEQGSDEVYDLYSRTMRCLAIIIIETTELDDLSKLFTIEEELRDTRFKAAVSELQMLICKDKNEQEYQEFLEEHTWFFGPRYVEQVKRGLTRDDQIDIALESINGYLDIIELKKPQSKVLNYDKSHDNYYPSHTLSKSISQVENYIHSLEQEEHRIFSQDGLQALKPRGRIIIGKNLSADQKGGLRVINSHLNRIEIITYSELLEIGKRSLKM